jgi:hypothetical protein
MDKSQVLSCRFRTRNRNEQVTELPNPSCAEIINMVQQGNKLIPFKSFATKYFGLSSIEKKIYIHYCDTYENFVVFESGYFRYKNNDNDILTSFKDSSGADFSLDIDIDDAVITHMGNILVLTDKTNSENYYWLFSVTDGDYGNAFTMPECANIIVEGKSITTVNPDTLVTLPTHETTVALNGNAENNSMAFGVYPTAGFTIGEAQYHYYTFLQETIAKAKQNGHIKGFSLFRVAYRLYDGSFVCPSSPKLVFTGTPYYYNNPDYFNDLPVIEDFDLAKQDNSGHKFYVFYVPQLFYSDFKAKLVVPATLPSIVRSVCIFASVPLEAYSYNAVINGSSISGSFSSNLDKLRNGEYINNANYYLVKEIPTSELSTWEGSYQNVFFGNIDLMVNLERLTIASNTTQRLIAERYLNYNSRLFGAGITTKLTNLFGEFAACDESTGGNYTFYFAVKLNTIYGDRYIYSPAITRDVNTSFPDIALFLSYPDRRATHIYLLLETAGVKYIKCTYTLTPHPTEDMAYYNGSAPFLIDNSVDKVSEDFIYSYPKEESLSGTTAFSYTENRLLTDINRIIASGLNNPYIFPFAQSYQVGFGEIMHIDAQTNIVSQGQFGQFPIVVFSKTGIYMLNISTAEGVVVDKIHLVSEVVAEQNTNFLNLNGKIFFMTNEGIKYIAGGQISDYLKDLLPILAKNTIPLSTDNNYNIFLNNPRTVELLDSVYDNEDQFITSDNHVLGYSPFYNCLILDNLLIFDNGFACKIDMSLTSHFVFNGQYMAVLGEDWSKLFNLHKINNDDSGALTSVAIITNPIDLSGFAKLERMIMKCRLLNSSSSIVNGLYLYGSIDGITWVMLAGNQDVGNVVDLSIPRINSSVKYVILIFAGNILDGSYIDRLDIMMSDSFPKIL